MLSFDVAATHWLNAWAGQNAVVDSLMTLITAAAVPCLVFAVAVQWWFPRPDRSTRHVVVAAGLSFLLGLGLNQLVLQFVHRARPYDAGVTHLLIDRSADFSFPSDHATAGFAIAAAFLLHGMPRRGLVFSAAAALAAVSRVYLGTHYMSDVLGGALTGVVAAAVVRAVYWENTRADRLVTSIM
jgi:undecaprenyl-diphosphatase